MPSLLNEIRLAARSLRRTPTVSIAAIACLALGLGATTAVFSAVNTALLRPLPFREPERLVSVFRTTPHFQTGPFSPGNVIDLRRETRTLAALAAIAPDGGLVERGGRSERVSAARVSGDLFTMLGATAARGRLLEAGDERAGQPPVAVLSEELWRERFGADAAIVGEAVRINGTPRTVVGIVPAGFRVPHGSQQLASEVYVPLVFDSTEALWRRSNYIWLVGRLGPGATPAQAEAEAAGLMRGLVEAHPELAGEGIRIVPLQREALRPVRGPLLLLLGAVGFVLLIAASNVASLLLARGVERRREVAIRSALGASGRDIVRRVLLEAGLLVGAGVAAGLALAWAGVAAIGALAAARLPQLAGLGLDGRVVAFALALAAGVALACGVAPAVRAARADPQDALRAGQRAGGDAGQHRFLRGLAVAEITLSLVLLLGAALVIRGFVRLTSQPPGFDAGPLLTLTVTMSSEREQGAPTVEPFLHPLLDAVRAVPGVRGAAAINLVPYRSWGNNMNIRYEGQPGADPTRLPLVETRVASAGLFETLGMTLLRGRLFETGDLRPGAPAVAVVNRALVERDFPGQDPVGRRFHLSDTTFATIVGVVSDIRNFGPEEAPRPELYWVYGQSQSRARSFPLVVRVAGNPAAAATAVTGAVHRVDPGAAVSAVAPMTEVMARAMGRPRFYVALLGAFAAVALVLALAGLYGLMSYLVAQRTREIGIRMALGSTPRQTVGLVFGQGGRLVTLGLAAGLAAAAGLTRLLRGLLYGVSPLDPLTWVLVSLALVAAAALAVLLPARRATRVDPLTSIRAE